MIIGFDAKRAVLNGTGLGNYSRFVIRILSEQCDGNDYHLYIPNESRMPYVDEIPTTDRQTLHFPQTPLWRKFGNMWRVFAMGAAVARDGIEVFHGLSNELPADIRRASCKTVVTIHDLIFKSHPEYYHIIDREIYDHKFRRACAVADRIIAVSEYTKREIMRYYHTTEEKIDVVYQGCDKSFSMPIAQEKLDQVRRSYNLPGEYLLYVGSIEERKNLMLVARALKRMGRRPMVVAVGRRTAYMNKVEKYLGDNGLTQNFLFLHRVAFADLASIYHMARAFVYPSRIEGFGIPMLEALCSGIPAIGCSGSCLEEAGGKDSLYVEPDDADGMATAINAVMNDDRLRQTMIAHGREYARRFEEKMLCERLLAVYNKVLR